MKGFAALIALLVLMAASAVYAQEKGHGPEGFMPGHGMGFIKMIDELKLTPEQKKLVAQALKDNREKAQALREDMKKAFEGMHAVMDKTPGDEAAVRQAARQMAKAGEELAVNHGQLKAKIDAILTPEQKAKRDELKNEKKGEFKERFKERRAEHQKAMDEWIEKNLK